MHAFRQAQVLAYIIPISHWCIELEGREWKEGFLLSNNDNRCFVASQTFIIN